MCSKYAFRCISTLLAAMAVGMVAHASREAILLEHPTYWYTYDNNALERSSGAANLPFSTTDAANVQLVAHDDGLGGYLSCSNSGCPYGGGFALGEGNWTYMMRIKAVTVPNRIIYCIGSIQAGKHGLVLYTKDQNTLTLAVIENFVNFEQRVDIAVDDVTAWHDYAFIFDFVERTVAIWVDGVKQEAALPHPNYSKGNQNWQWFSMYGGLGRSGLDFGLGCAIDDVRFYQRALTQTEISALIEGRTQVPVYGGFLSTTDMLVWKNLQLKDIVRLRTRCGGTSIGKTWAVPFYETRTTGDITVQMQFVDDGTYNKVTKLQFYDAEGGIFGKVLYSKYCQPSAGGINATQGNDFDVNPQNNQTVAFGNETGGYGLHQLTADTLYDDDAAIWSAADGALSVPANWRDSSAAAAGRPLSFVTGTGTVQNDFPAGTAFGRLSMGVESGARTVGGNACSFEEVLNVSTSPLTFTAPLAYAGDFQPYTLGTMTFTDLTVGGVFQPVGSGDIQFSGNTEIAKADLRYNVRTRDGSGYGAPVWAASSGYLDNVKQQTYLLRTLPGGSTYIGELLMSQCGQRSQVTILDGDFVIGGSMLPGHDARVVVTNGTTRLENPYSPSDGMGINAHVYVHGDGTLTMPGINATTAIFMHLDGTVNAGDVSSTASFYLYDIDNGGTFNARLLRGNPITVSDVTVGPEASLLAIPSAITLGQREGGPGVIFRAAAPDGTPSLISMSGALNPGSVPFTVAGGGDFIYQNAGSLTFGGRLAVAADTTADFSACASVTIADAALAAGAKLVLPPATIFASKPALPETGTAALAFKPGLSAAGTYSLGASGWTAADLERLAITIEGDYAARYTFETAVVDGAFVLTLADTPAVPGAKSSRLLALGYAGSTTLSQFPALIKLPAQAKDFRYDESTADGSDLWFADANGNRIPHEIESWNTSGDSFIWVRVPSLNRETAITVHWGDAASKPVLADAQVFGGDYLGVWHFADTTWTDSSPNALEMSAVGAPTVRGAKIGAGFYNAAGANRIQTPNDAKWLAYADTRQLTLSGWLKADSVAANLRIISSKSVWDTQGGFELTTRGSSATEFLAGCNHSAQYTKAGIPSYMNNWVHFTVVYDGTLETPESRMYINGACLAKAIGADYIPIAKDEPLAIGGASNSDATPFLGGLDEIRMAKTIPSDDWIRAEYDTQNSPTTFFTELDSDYFIVTGNTFESAAPTFGTTEYAGTHLLAFDLSTTPIVITGDVTATTEFGLFQFYDAPVTVKEGGTLTLARNVYFADYNTLTPPHPFGARLVIEGGLVQAPHGSLDYSGYNPAVPDTLRPMEIVMTGGKFTATMKGWQIASGNSDQTNSKVNVGGNAEFAPDAIGWRNSVGNDSGVVRWFVTMDGNGRFTLPASGVPSVMHVEVAGGTPSFGTADESYFAGTLEVPADQTLAIATGTVINTGVIAGEGTLTVESGAVLDLSDPDGDAGEFAGAIVVKNGGVLILPANRTPAYIITLEAGAHVIATVEDAPSGTAPFLGALAAVPGEGTATIEFDLPQSVPQDAVYTLTTTQLPEGSAEHLALVFTGAASASTQGVIEQGEGGEVQVRITESSASGALEWKGGDFLGTSWWQRDGEDDTLYPFMPNVPLWFTDRSEQNTVTVPAGVKGDLVVFSGAKDYQLRGEKLTARRVVKDGTGTLTLDGNGFATDDVTVKAGTLKLGDSVARNVLGGNEAALTIEDGATLDLNTQLITSGNAERGAVLNDHVVVITGSGVDGKGAVIDQNPTPDMWQFSFGRIQVKGDALIGGTSRIDIRKGPNSSFEGRCWLRGGENDTLYVRTSVDEAVQCGFNMNTADVDIGRIVLDVNGVMAYEGDSILNVKHGVELRSGSRLQYWNAPGKKAAIVVTGAGAGIKASGGDNNVQDAPVSVQGGASLDLRGDRWLSFKDWFLNDGALTVSGGYHQFVDAAVTNNGSIVVCGGEIDLKPTEYVGSLQPTITAGAMKVGGGTDWTAVDMAFTMTGGSLCWGLGDADGFPQPGEGKIDVSGITGGYLYFLTAKDETIPQFFTAATPAKLFVLSAHESDITTLPAGNYQITERLDVADGYNYGHLQLGDGANVTAKAVGIATSSASPKSATLELLPGSTLTVQDNLINGVYSGASDYVHYLLINGGTLNHLNMNLLSAYDTPRGYTILNSGVMNVIGIDSRNRSNYIYANSDERFTMNGGTLNLGMYGFWTTRIRYNRTDVDLVGGRYVATADHAVRRYGLLLATGNALDAEKGEGLTLDLNGHTVDHSFTPHFGVSDVKLVGSGAYTTSSDLQGVVRGKWTVDTEPGTRVDFSGFSGFAGGLELKEGTSAELGISGEGMVEFAYLPMGFDDAYAYVANNGLMPSIATHMRKMTLFFDNNSGPVNNCAFAVRGQFYVPEEDAGTWTFAGNYDDYIGLWVDGTQVFYNGSWNALAHSTTNVSAGWHDFILVTYDGSGGQGTYMWQNHMCLGWQKGTLTSTVAADYNRFDTSTLRMRVKPVPGIDGVTAYRATPGSDYNTVETLAANENWTLYGEDVSLMSLLNTQNAGFQQSCAGKLTGGFLVEPQYEGEWTFICSWDDGIQLYIDGRRVVDNGSNWEYLGQGTAVLKTGWHSFEIRTQDGSGGYGTDAKGINDGMALAVIRPGDAAKQPFDERTICFTKQALIAQRIEKAGLGGESVIAAGAELRNGAPWSSGDLAGRFCPIYGSIGGAGTLNGAFRFTGEDNCWSVKADPHHLTEKLVFDNADENTLAGLKRIRVEFSERPVTEFYELSLPLGLTAATAANIKVEAPIPPELRVAADGDKTDFEFSAVIKDGKLFLKNAHPAGTAIILR